MSITTILKTSGLCMGIALALGATSCTKMIQPEQLTELRTLRAREVQLNKSITDRESQKAKLQKELAARQQETKQCNDRRTFVLSKLNSFPNSLGEPLPEAPPPPPEPEKKVKGKKK